MKQIFALGETCSNPIPLGLISNNNNWNTYTMNDSVLYISFIADTTNIRLDIIHGVAGFSNFPEWKSIKLFHGNTCTNPDLIWSHSTYVPGDSLIQAILDSNIIEGDLYTFKFLRKYNPDTCGNCNVAATFMLNVKTAIVAFPFHLGHCDDPCQLNCNGQFTNFPLVCIQGVPSDEFKCNIPCWQDGNLSPQLREFNMNPWAAMWSRNGRSEAIVTTLADPILMTETYFWVILISGVK
ncbi:MAG: hypothetical protein IPO27_09790 [Bacteroidetes bacterium]|nr:hypothetical protein [Bacteroidota bacterium]